MRCLLNRAESCATTPGAEVYAPTAPTHGKPASTGGSPRAAGAGEEECLVTQETVRFRSGRATYLRTNLYERPNSAQRVDAHAEVDYDKVEVRREVYRLSLHGYRRHFNGSPQYPATENTAPSANHRTYARRHATVRLYSDGEYYFRSTLLSHGRTPFNTRRS